MAGRLVEEDEVRRIEVRRVRAPRRPPPLVALGGD